MECSDKHIAYVCTNPECGSLIAPTHELRSVATAGRETGGRATGEKYVCRYCHAPNAPTNPAGSSAATTKLPSGVEESKSHCEPVALPYVFRYLTNELAGMNIRITLKTDGFAPEI